MTDAPGLSTRQKVSNLMARYLQKPLLALPLPTRVARFLFDLNARIVYRTPRDMTLRRDSLGGVPCAWCGREGQARDGVLLYLHGGGFVIGSVRSHRHMVAQLAAEAGLEGLLVDYRMAPEHPFPAALDDALAVYRALLDQGRAPDRIMLAGDSAGGALVLSLLHLIAAQGLPMPRAVAVLSPITDLTFSDPSLEGNRATELLIPESWGRRSIEAYLAGQDPRDPRASPLFADMRGWPPVLIHVAREEILFSDSQRLAGALRQAGVEAPLAIWRGVPHVWHLMAGRVPEADRALSEIAAFLRARLS